ncbi:MAG: MlaD family protein [Solirubrobacteraceae bacterium]
MRRVLATAFVLAACGAAVFLTVGAGGDKNANGTYYAEFDNAFGLITGGDLKVAGVRAGKVTELKLDRKTNRAIVGFTIDKNGFGQLHKDAFCESRPQSLIGEYFVDCRPGTSKQVLKPGQTIPVTQTASTISPDLIGDVMRRPYRERLSMIIGGLGAGVAGNGQNLNDTIRRAVPALRETDNVLAILAKQNTALRDLNVNADTVVGDLAANKKDVARWVDKANKTSQISASRRRDIAAGLQRLPGFLAELEPTMKELGSVADDQGATLQKLDAQSKNLTETFNLLGPFANASRPAFRTLGDASQAGDKAVKTAPATVRQLAAFAKGTPELGSNLAIILEHLDNRKFAIEKDPRSPGGQGYTGLEALLQYVYDQTMSTATYTANSHQLKVAAFVDKCAEYADIKRLKDNNLEQDCGSRLGPVQPGINYPDPTGQTPAREAQTRGARKRADNNGAPQPPDPAPQLPGASSGGGPAPDTKPEVPNAPAAPSAPSAPSVPSLPPKPTLPDVGVGGTKGTASPPPLPTLAAKASSNDPQAQTRLLDYLLSR